jgi:hypothetical protein
VVVLCFNVLSWILCGRTEESKEKAQAEVETVQLQNTNHDRVAFGNLNYKNKDGCLLGCSAV